MVFKFDLYPKNVQKLIFSEDRKIVKYNSQWWYIFNQRYIDFVCSQEINSKIPGFININFMICTPPHLDSSNYYFISIASDFQAYPTKFGPTFLAGNSYTIHCYDSTVKMSRNG